MYAIRSIPSFFLFLLTLSTTIGGTLGAEYHHILSANDFTSFAENVKNGNDYSGTTVLLDSDITLSETIESIGTSLNQFRGVFDGQGNAISSLAISSSSESVGLFGYSSGLTVRNVVLDGSCSVTSLYGDSNGVNVGSIIGYCYPNNGNILIENTVNMGTVSFSRNIKGSLYLGGIVGYLYSSSFSSFTIYVKNCANYGNINKRSSNSESRIGGIVGSSSGNSNTYIQNCLNYGTITHSGSTTSALYVGGIVGFNYYTQMKNCVSAGEITISNAPSTAYSGGVAGYVNPNPSISIDYCYYTDNVGVTKLYGDGSPKSTSGTPTTASSLDSSLLKNLNDQAVSGWNKWLSNTNSAKVSFKINNNKGFSVSSQLILLPTLAPTGSNKFSGWYTETIYSQLFQSTSVATPTTFYGLYGIIYDVTFDGNGGNSPSFTSKKVVYEGTYGTLPTVKSITGYTFDGWYTTTSEGTKIESSTKVDITSNHTLYAHWTGNTYIVSFYKNGGDAVSKEAKNVTYDNTYGDLPTATRTGYTFTGWFTAVNEGTKIETNTKVTITGPQTLYAHWTINSYNLTFDFDNGTATKVRRVGYNATVTYIENPERKGYTFNGWDRVIEFMPAEDVTITALWKAKNYTIIFDDNGGNPLSEPESKEVTYNEEYGDLPEPSKIGYNFVGWFNEKNESVNSSTPVSFPYDHTLTAYWNINQYTITFDVDGGSECENITQDYSTEVELPTPTKTGYTFDCWCSDPELSREYTEATMPAENVTLYAKWTAINYIITFDFGNGTVLNIVLLFNSTIEYPENMKREGFTFNGWTPSPERMPTENITIRARWNITKPSEYVKIVFTKNEISEEEVKWIIKEYVPSGEFTITKFESGSDGMRVIVKFRDEEEAQNFVESLQEKSNTLIKTANFIFGNLGSFSSSLSLNAFAKLIIKVIL